MGACFVTKQYPGELGQDQIRKLFQADQETDRVENGRSYSGGIGMADGLTFGSEEPFSISDAEEWLSSNAEKWGPAIAVHAYHGPGRVWVVGAVCAE